MGTLPAVWWRGRGLSGVTLRLMSREAKSGRSEFQAEGIVCGGSEAGMAWHFGNKGRATGVVRIGARSHGGT